MKFLYFRWFWITDFESMDTSVGFHICWKGRIDLHLLWWMLSFGRVPIFQTRSGRKFAASNSFYEDRKQEPRAGVPDHNPNC